MKRRAAAKPIALPAPSDVMWTGERLIAHWKKAPPAAASFVADPNVERVVEIAGIAGAWTVVKWQRADGRFQLEVRP